jgi:hypothetical protein
MINFISQRAKQLHQPAEKVLKYLKPLPTLSNPKTPRFSKQKWKRRLRMHGMQSQTLTMTRVFIFKSHLIYK